MIKGQDSTIMLTVATNSICDISKIIDGAASITEMPTLLKLAVYMPPPLRQKRRHVLGEKNICLKIIPNEFQDKNIGINYLFLLIILRHLLTTYD